MSGSMQRALRDIGDGAAVQPVALIRGAGSAEMAECGVVHTRVYRKPMPFA
jgi:hypothetical protein